MGDIFQTSVSGMLAYQQALATTSHNISNVNTPGYSRQRTEFTTLTPSLVGGGWSGTGVGVDAIRRMADDMRSQLVRGNTSEYGRLDTFAELSGRIDNLLADKNAGLAPAMEAFFSAVQAASTDPATPTVRNVMLTEAQNLASRFHFLDQRLTELDGEVNHRIETTVDEINEMAGAVARLNQDIAVALGASQGAPPNDLLDKRDALLEQISERVSTQVVRQNDGMVSVFIGNGQALVTGATANKLAITENEYDATRREIAFESSGNTVNVTRNLSGGTLGGLLDFRRESLDVMRNELGQVATALTTQFNQQHRLGVSFDGGQARAGGDFFEPLGVQVLASTHNSATASGMPSVTLDPAMLGELTASDYRLQRVAGSWELTRLADGTSWTLPASPAPDGLDIDMSGVSGAVDGDRFLIQPTRLGAQEIDLALTRVSEVAWGNPVLGGEATGPDGEATNTGTGSIRKLQYDGDVAAMLANGSITLAYTDDADGAGNPGFTVSGTATPAYVLYDGTPQTYTLSVQDGGGATIGSLSFEMVGLPEDGDSFVVEANTNGRGDNANLLALARLQTTPTLNGGDATLQEFYSGVVGRAGSQSLRANVNRDAQEVLLGQAQEAREQMSGVNLEEEAANMLRFQQAFQASAQMVTVANTLFQSLLDAVR